MSALGQKRTFAVCFGYVRYTSKSGHRAGRIMWLTPTARGRRVLLLALRAERRRNRQLVEMLAR